MLVRRGGRLGLVLPSGFATDHTAAALRRRLLTRSNIDTISGFDNRKAIFPIHRSVRFLICTATAGAPTSHIACRFGIDDPKLLETIPDAGDRPDGPTHPITLTASAPCGPWRRHSSRSPSCEARPMCAFSRASCIGFPGSAMPRLGCPLRSRAECHRGSSSLPHGTQRASGSRRKTHRAVSSPRLSGQCAYLRQAAARLLDANKPS